MKWGINVLGGYFEGGKYKTEMEEGGIRIANRQKAWRLQYKKNTQAG